MVGRYPFVEPSSKGPFADAGPARGPEVGRENLRALLDADIDTFVCLQDELPPQGEMPAGGIGGFLRYDTEIAALAEEAGSDPRGLEFVKFSIVDMTVPTQDYLVEIVADLEERVRRGRNLYIHCWGGRGRAGTVGAALMAALYEADGSEILELVQAGYSSRGFDDYKSPETMDQRRTVHRFVKRLGEGGA
jgi:alanine transaminase